MWRQATAGKYEVGQHWALDHPMDIQQRFSLAHNSAYPVNSNYHCVSICIEILNLRTFTSDTDFKAYFNFSSLPSANINPLYH
jgi:hypothetical protein